MDQKKSDVDLAIKKYDEEITSLNLELEKLMKQGTQGEQIRVLQTKKIVLEKKKLDFEITQQSSAVEKTASEIKKFMLSIFNDMKYSNAESGVQGKETPQSYVTSYVAQLTKQTATDYRKNLYEKYMSILENLPKELRKAFSTIASNLVYADLKTIPKEVKISVYDEKDKHIYTYSRNGGEPIVIGRDIEDIDIDAKKTDPTVKGISRVNCLVIPMWDNYNTKVVFFVIDFWSIIGTRVLDSKLQIIGETKTSKEEKTRALIIVSGTNFFVQVGGIVNNLYDLGVDPKGMKYKFVTEINK